MRDPVSALESHACDAVSCHAHTRLSTGLALGPSYVVGQEVCTRHRYQIASAISCSPHVVQALQGIEPALQLRSVRLRRLALRCRGGAHCFELGLACRVGGARVGDLTLHHRRQLPIRVVTKPLRSCLRRCRLTQGRPQGPKKRFKTGIKMPTPGSRPCQRLTTKGMSH